MTGAPIEVSDWLDAKTLFHPRMSATIGLPVPDALGQLANALTSQGFKVKGFRVKEANASGFTATWWDKTGWLGVIAITDMDFKRTRLAVTAVPTASGATLTIQVEKGAEHRAGRRKGREALTEAFQDAQRRGITVTTTPWEKP